jgi:hypothetical protein
MAAGIFESALGIFQKRANAKKEREQAQRDADTRQKLLASLDYEPMYASQTTPTYQRTQSPVARSYIESFLTGSNPDATFSGSPNANYQKSQQQTAQNKAFGTPQQRIAQQRSFLQEQPWKVATPTRTVKASQAAAQQTVADENLLNPKGTNLRFTPEEIAYARKTGLIDDRNEFRDLFAMVQLDEDRKRGKV